MATVFLLLSVVVLGPLVDSPELTTLERTSRVVGGIALVLLATVSIYQARRRGGG
ncbi:hypothetical protein K7640_28245 [Micromonospora sp. PLK6-60]|uniref:hypothetical protein n=1 Tax=Micromonospora sp. PLK6-60 TaxID=2873383 RepID=UPI001CA6E92B|nr:hypothetical protein [Micromonospora sp. PLK6-60]MBY8875726.1 hypothetical protein [Micromonospora sp. PLK6-60]